MLGAEENYTQLEIVRPVEDAEQFLSKVRHIGTRVFGLAPSTFVTEMSDPSEESGAVAVITDVGTPRLHVYDKLALVLLERIQPLADFSASRINQAAHRLTAVAQHRYRPARNGTEDQTLHTSSLYEALRQTALQFDIPDATRLSLTFSSIGNVMPKYTGPDRGDELALIPDASQIESLLVTAEARLCFDGLRIHSRKVAYPAQSHIPHVRFARMPVDASLDEKSEFVARLQGLLPIKFVVAQVQKDISSKQDIVPVPAKTKR